MIDKEINGIKQQIKEKEKSHLKAIDDGIGAFVIKVMNPHAKEENTKIQNIENSLKELLMNVSQTNDKTQSQMKDITTQNTNRFQDIHNETKAQEKQNKDKIVQLQDSIADIQQQLQSYTDKSKEIQEKTKQLDDEIENINKQTLESKNSIETNITKRTNENQTQIKELNQKLNSLSIKDPAKDTQKDISNELYDKIQSQIDDTNQSHNKLNQHVQSINKQIDTLLQQSLPINDKFKEIEKSVEDHKQTIENRIISNNDTILLLKAKIENNENENTTKLQQIRLDLQDMQKQTQKYNQYNDTLQQLRLRLEKIESEMTQGKAEEKDIQQLKFKVENIEKSTIDSARNTDIIQQIRIRVENIENDIKNISNGTENNKAIQQKIEQLEKEIAEKQSNNKCNDTNEVDFNDLLKQIVALKLKIDNIENEIQEKGLSDQQDEEKGKKDKESVNSPNDHTQQISTLMEKIESIEKQYKEEITITNEDISNIKAKIESTDKELDKINKETPQVLDKRIAEISKQINNDIISITTPLKQRLENALSDAQAYTDKQIEAIKEAILQNKIKLESLQQHMQAHPNKERTDANENTSKDTDDIAKIRAEIKISQEQLQMQIAKINASKDKIQEHDQRMQQINIELATYNDNVVKLQAQIGNVYTKQEIETVLQDKFKEQLQLIKDMLEEEIKQFTIIMQSIIILLKERKCSLQPSTSTSISNAFSKISQTHNSNISSLIEKLSISHIKFNANIGHSNIGHKVEPFKSISNPLKAEQNKIIVVPTQLIQKPEYSNQEAQSDNQVKDFQQNTENSLKNEIQVQTTPKSMEKHQNETNIIQVSQPTMVIESNGDSLEGKPQYLEEHTTSAQKNQRKGLIKVLENDTLNNDEEINMTSPNIEISNENESIQRSSTYLSIERQMLMGRMQYLRSSPNEIRRNRSIANQKHSANSKVQKAEEAKKDEFNEEEFDNIEPYSKVMDYGSMNVKEYLSRSVEKGRNSNNNTELVKSPSDGGPSPPNIKIIRDSPKVVNDVHGEKVAADSNDESLEISDKDINDDNLEIKMRHQNVAIAASGNEENADEEEKSIDEGKKRVFIGKTLNELIPPITKEQMMNDEELLKLNKQEMGRLGIVSSNSKEQIESKEELKSIDLKDDDDDDIDKFMEAQVNVNAGYKKFEDNIDEDYGNIEEDQ